MPESASALKRRVGQPPRWLGFLATIGIVIALYMVFIYAPEERTMGVVQRIFYFHVGLAYNAYLAFFLVFISGIVYLARRRWQWDAVAGCAGELGVLFTSLTLLTGMLWARPAWNAWWTWDPRLTTTLIMWFMYVAYLLVRAGVDGEERRARVTSVFGIIAFLNIPLVHYSAQWWRGLHPIVLDTQGGRPTMNIDPNMALALLAAVMGLTVAHAYLFAHRVQLEFLSVRVRRLKERLHLSTE